LDLKRFVGAAAEDHEAADAPLRRLAFFWGVLPRVSPSEIPLTAARLVLGFMLALFLNAGVLAQVRPDAGSILEQTKPTPAAPRPGTDILPRLPEPKPALGAPGLKVDVTGFKITGNTVYPEAVLLETVREFVGKEQNIDGLNDAATKVRAYYRERGYFLVQAYLPRQEIKGGVVEIAVIEARIGKVALNLKEGTRYSEGMIRGIVARHLQEGDIITENGLETPLLLLNDFPNAVVSSEIKPSKTIGSADLTVHVSDEPGWLSGSVEIDNYGNRFTGAIRTGLSLDISNPLGLGDRLSYHGFTTDERMGFYRVAYMLPVGYWGTRLGVSYSSFHYRLGREFIAAGNHGVGGVSTVFAFHPVIRTRSSNLIVQFAYEHKKLDDRDDVNQTVTDRNIYSSKLGVVGDFRDGAFGGGLNSYSYTITEGNLDITPAVRRAEDQAASGLKTQGRFAKHNFEFRRLQKITDNATLLLSLSGQTASKNMSSAERFSLGGPSGVRAYPTGEAGGDMGYVFQGEFRYLLPGFKLAGGDVTLTGFYDQGAITKICKDFIATACAAPVTLNQNKRALSGYGVGGSIGKDSDFVLRASIAWRNENELPQSDTAARIPRVWVQGTKWF
jgi:hemolysin activation/secretion protein